MDLQAAPRHDLRGRHPRPGRGDDHGRPHRGDEQGQGRPGRAARPRSTSSPKTRFVAEFVGDVNLFEGPGGRAERGGRWRIRRAGADAADRRGPRRRRSAVGEGVGVAVRPEKMALSTRPASAGRRNMLAGEVWDIGYLGDWTDLPRPARLRRDAARRPGQRGRASSSARSAGTTGSISPSRPTPAVVLDAMRRRPRGRASRLARALATGLPFLWLAVFFLLPFLIVLKISLSDAGDGAAALSAAVRWVRPRRGRAASSQALDLENFRAARRRQPLPPRLALVAADRGDLDGAPAR